MYLYFTKKWKILRWKSYAEKFTINSNKYALFGGSGYGPTFGKDITTKGESNINPGRHSDFGWSYNLPDGYNNPEQQELKKLFLTGNYINWLTTEIEVHVFQDWKKNTWGTDQFLKL